MKKTLVEFYTADPATCPDISRLVSTRHTARLIKCVCVCVFAAIGMPVGINSHRFVSCHSMLDDKSIEILIGGKHDVDKKFIEPTIVCIVLVSACLSSY